MHARAPLLLPSVARCRGPAPDVLRFEHEGHARLPFELRGQHIWVRGRVNGADSVWIVIDTGASASAMDAPVARELELRVTGHHDALGAGGSQPGGRVAGVTLGPPGCSLTQPSMNTLDLSAFTVLAGRPMQVILGDELFRDCVVRLDYPARMLDAWDAQHAPGELHNHIARADSFMLGSLRFVAPTLVMPDSGSGHISAAGSLGNIGGQLLGRCRVTFDYAHQIVRFEPADEIVLLANDRCNQENPIEQLKNGAHALRMPVGTRVSNGAYMVMASLAWTPKAWFALLLPETGRWGEQYAAEKRTVLRMEFRTFQQAFIAMPCQIIRAGRRIVYRLLACNPWQGVFLRGVEALRLPLRC